MRGGKTSFLAVVGRDNSKKKPALFSKKKRVLADAKRGAPSMPCLFAAPVTVSAKGNDAAKEKNGWMYGKARASGQASFLADAKKKKEKVRNRSWRARARASYARWNRNVARLLSLLLRTQRVEAPKKQPHSTSGVGSRSKKKGGCAEQVAKSAMGDGYSLQLDSRNATTLNHPEFHSGAPVPSNQAPEQRRRKVASGATPFPGERGNGNGKGRGTVQLRVVHFVNTYDHPSSTPRENEFIRKDGRCPSEGYRIIRAGRGVTRWRTRRKVASGATFEEENVDVRGEVALLVWCKCKKKEVGETNETRAEERTTDSRGSDGGPTPHHAAGGRISRAGLKLQIAIRYER
ncbi:hypothetical protein BC826DRAFT_643721 [Russula brevipes]|nr:hypothetical protein BC826DRAFT_643721 [Russula brevipes]